MASIFRSGFELNSTTASVEWSATNTTGVSLSTTTVRTGTYALRCNGFSSGTVCGIRYHYKASDSNGPFFYRFYFRYATLPSAANVIATCHNTAFSGGAKIKITLNTDATLQLADEDGNVGSASAALSANTWYLIEMQLDRTPAAGSHVIEAKLNGSVFATSSARNLSTGVANFRIGANLSSEAQTTGDWFFDDIAINDNTGSFQTSYPGAAEIRHLRPNAAGDASDWSNDYTVVDEVTPNDVTDFAASLLLNDTDDHNIDDTPAGIGSGDTINMVAVGVRYREAATAGTTTSFVMRIKASSGGTVEESAAITPSGTTWVTNANSEPRLYPLILYDLPGASTTAWTKSDLDAAQIGYRVSTLGTDAANISTVWLLVDSTPAADLSVNVSDNVTVTESVLRTLVSDVNKSESVTVTDTLIDIIRGDTRDVNKSEAVTVTESVGRMVESYVNKSDSVTVTESLKREVESSINKSDNVTVTEAATAEVITEINKSESVAVSESVTAFVPFLTVIVSDSVTVSESLKLQVESYINKSESVTVSENTTLDIPLQINKSDNVTITESAVAQIIIEVNKSESVSVSESLARMLESYINKSESVTITENTQLDIPVAINKSEAVNVTENATAEIIIEINKSENITVTELVNLGFAGDKTITLSDSVTVSELVNLFIPEMSIGISESVIVTEALSMRFRYGKWYRENNTAFETKNSTGWQTPKNTNYKTDNSSEWYSDNSTNWEN